MRLSASDFHTFYQPEECDARVFLRAIKAPEKDLSPYVQVLIDLGLHFEKLSPDVQHVIQAFIRSLLKT